MINRRGLITGLISLAAAPAIVRASILMPVKVIRPIITEYWNDKIYSVDILYGIMKLQEYKYGKNFEHCSFLISHNTSPKLD